VDGFNQDHDASGTDKGIIARLGLFTAHCHTFEPFQFPDGLLDTSKFNRLFDGRVPNHVNQSSPI
jgi:hypothetical protein